MALDSSLIRKEFPALSRPVLFLDNPGGTQITRRSLDRIQDYLVNKNANHGGAFITSQLSDSLVEDTRRAAADFLHASRPEEIVLGPNMTSLTFNISRALARTFNPGDTIVVTRLDHDANISPWLMAAEDRGCKIRWVDFHLEDCTLDLDDFQKALQENPRLVALGYSSNAVGTINPIAKMTAQAHAAGALVYIDAVQYAPHGPIDVQALGCDFLVCSAYKFFGPHVGVLFGKYELLEELKAYKVRPAPLLPPGKFETGTGNFEGMSGTLGAMEYLEWIGSTFGTEFKESASGYLDRKQIFKQAMSAIRAYEFEISREFVRQLEDISGLQLFGITDTSRLEERVPTISFTLKGWTPKELAVELGRENVYVWDGNFYALAVTERLGLESKGGLLRSGAVHYNTIQEIQHFGDVIRKLALHPRH
jgi:cysteine desulfurase family protein (TIGR01976 family)